MQAASKNGNDTFTLKEDLEEADIKVEQVRDQLAYEMFTFLKKENELANYMLKLLECQKSYHEDALRCLNEVIPDLKYKIENSSVKPVFGIPLEDHLRVQKRRLAFPLDLCICILNKIGISEEGLFRIAGSKYIIFFLIKKLFNQLFYRVRDKKIIPIRGFIF